MNEPLNEAELRGLEGQPDPLYSYAILRRSAAEIRTLRARLAQLESVLAEAREAITPFARLEVLIDDEHWVRIAVLVVDNESGVVDTINTNIMSKEIRRAATVSAKIDAMDTALKEKSDEA